MFSKILVGTDGSDTADAAVERAAAIAELTGGEVIVLNAYRTLPPMGDIGVAAVVSDPGMMVEDGKELLARVETHIGARVPVRTTLRRGDPAHAIIDAAKQEGVDLIVVGNRGMRGARRMLGSVPNSVAHGASCDVLIVHTG
jgi:nucleotide-binding universal stress UspA family protein